MKWAPYKFIRMPGMTAHFAGFANVAADAPPEKKGLGNGVRTVEGRDADREDDVECSGGAKVDDADETGDASQDIDSVVRDCRLGVHLGERNSDQRKHNLGT